jgi:hypothetical protein
MVPSSSPTPTVEVTAADADQAAINTVDLPLVHRPRRLRRTEALRRMVRETVLTVDDLIYPMFVMEGIGQRQEVPSMLGCYRYSLDLLLEEIREVVGLGIGAIAQRSISSLNGAADSGLGRGRCGCRGATGPQSLAKRVRRRPLDRHG